MLAAHLERHYRLRGEFSVLTGERDQNYRLTVDGRPAFVVKVAHPAELPAIIEAQALAASHIRASDPSLPVQAVSLTVAGFTTSVLSHDGEDRLVRVVEWLPGEILASVTLTSELANSIGSTLARIGRALRTYSNPHAAQDLLWDLSQAMRLAELLPPLRGDPMFGHVEQALTAYGARVPKLNALPKQAIHADFNPHNILVDAAGTRVVGVLDFGDMQIAPRACDLAISSAYLTGSSEDPFRYIELAVAAYHREDPLEDCDASMLVDLIAMRHAMTILITEWRARHHPDSAAYILRNNAAARRGLAALADGGRDKLASRLIESLAI